MKITKKSLVKLEDKPIELFYQGIRSQETRVSYTRKLRKILCEYLEEIFEEGFESRAAQFVYLAKQDPDETIRILLSLSRLLKERTEKEPSDKDYLNPSSFANFFKPIKKLFDMNGIGIPWKRVYATYPELDNLSDGRGYTKEEIQTMLNFAQGAVDHAIILVEASSGVRAGGLSGLKWEDIEPVYKVDDQIVLETTESQMARAEVVCAVLRIYAHSDQEYPAFITPEAYHAIQGYRKSWIMDVGREPKPHEPLFKKAGPFVKPLNDSGIRQRMVRVVKKAGIRTPLVKGKRRHEIPTMNGFRRFWNKTSKESVSKDSPLADLIKKEFMMGHVGLTKLDKNYFKVHIMELVEEYLTIMPNLTISDEERINAENRKLRLEKTELENEKYKVTKLEQEFKNVTIILNELQKRVGKNQRVGKNCHS